VDSMIGEAPRLQLQQMRVTDHHVQTPIGVYDLAGTRWRWESSWGADRVQPTWSFVMGLLTFWTVIGIAFFFVLRADPWGRVTVTMTTPDGAWWSETVQVNATADRVRLEQSLMLLDNWSIAAQRQITG
jgi:hypothetical protein